MAAWVILESVYIFAWPQLLQMKWASWQEMLPLDISFFNLPLLWIYCLESEEACSFFLAHISFTEIALLIEPY